MELDIPPKLADTPMENQHRVAAALWVHHWTRQDKPRSEMVQRLAIVRQHHYPGYRWLISNHNEAALIKVRLKWHDPDDEQSNWQDEASVRTSVREVWELAKQSVPVAAAALAALRSAIERFSPQFLHLVPSSVAPAKPQDSDIGLAARSTVPPPPPVTAAAPKPPLEPDPLTKFREKHGRDAGSLTAERLEALRGQNGRLAAARKANADIAAQWEREAAEASFPHRDYPGTPKAAQPPSEADYGACPKPEHPPRHPMPWDTPS